MQHTGVEEQDGVAPQGLRQAILQGIAAWRRDEVQAAHVLRGSIDHGVHPGR